jgi:hypothetical protein
MYDAMLYATKVNATEDMYISIFGRLTHVFIVSRCYEIQLWYKNREKKSGYDLLLAKNAMQRCVENS